MRNQHNKCKVPRRVRRPLVRAGMATDGPLNVMPIWQHTVLKKASVAGWW